MVAQIELLHPVRAAVYAADGLLLTLHLHLVAELSGFIILILEILWILDMHRHVMENLFPVFIFRDDHHQIVAGRIKLNHFADSLLDLFCRRVTAKLSDHADRPLRSILHLEGIRFKRTVARDHQPAVFRRIAAQRDVFTVANLAIVLQAGVCPVRSADERGGRAAVIGHVGRPALVPHINAQLAAQLPAELAVFPFDCNPRFSVACQPAIVFDIQHAVLARADIHAIRFAVVDDRHIRLHALMAGICANFFFDLSVVDSADSAAVRTGVEAVHRAIVLAADLSASSGVEFILTVHRAVIGGHVSASLIGLIHHLTVDGAVVGALDKAAAASGIIVQRLVRYVRHVDCTVVGVLKHTAIKGAVK